MWNKQVNDMENVMAKMKVCSLVLSVLLILVLVPVVSAEEPKTKITYISYAPSDIFGDASQTNVYSDFIEYTAMPLYNLSTYGPSDELLAAVESGFLETQNVILCQGLHPDYAFSDPRVNDSFKAAHDRGTALYSIQPMGSTPSYFDYDAPIDAGDTVANYYSNMVNDTLEESVRLENAENLLIYLTINKKITYISYAPSDIFGDASQTNVYSDFIEYTAMPLYNLSTYGPSDELLAAVESGFLETQNVILCQGLHPDYAFSDPRVNDSFKAAHDRGTALYSIQPMGSTPSYFDYDAPIDAGDTVANYYSNMVNDTLEESVRLENAENLLIYLTMNTKVTYISYAPSDILGDASQTNVYSDFIEYTAIPLYNLSTYGPSDELLAAVESGFLETQNVILCQGLHPDYAFSDPRVNDSFKAAHDRGTALYSIQPMGSTPSYFDYDAPIDAGDTVANYYSNMVNDTLEESLKLENAENLLLHLATYTPTLLKVAIMSDYEVNPNEFVFVLGTDFNRVALNNASQDTNISENLNITIFTKDNPVPEGFDFSNYGLIFIESQDKSVVDGWTSSIKSAKTGGAKVIGYNLSSNITLPNVDLYSDEYTDIERYWVQGGETNMESMLKFMGQNFSGFWEGEEIPEPVLMQEKVNITFIIGVDTNRYSLSKIITERSVITDCFNINVMSGSDAVANLTDASDQDFIILYMIGPNDISDLESVFSDAKNNGAQIGFGSGGAYGTIDMQNPPHNVMQEYLSNDGYTNMENLVRYIGAKLDDVYIEYSPVAPPLIPDDGIYHPDYFPKIFENSTEYLEWYADNGYNASAPTIGIINYEIQKEPIYFTTDNAIIRYLESKGCNVIYTTQMVCNDNVDYFTKDGEVLVDSIIHLKAFHLNYDNQEQGVEYLKKYNVPILKGVQDPFTTPEEFYNSTHGTNPMSLPSQVTQPEIDGCTDFIWISGTVQNPKDPGKFYFEPIISQVEWLCDRAIGWAELGRTSNEDKKISILYYNHEGGKENIGASYLDISSSFTLLLEQMQAEGYDIGNGTIPNGSEFIDLFIESRNVGSWAPGELEKVVNSGKVTLLPVDEYLVWYNTLPESVRAEVEATWGEAPGDIMVYEDNFVIPTVQLGNINFIPQPTKAKLSDESLTYHNKSIPLTHQYLAAYFWINKVYDADAIVHFGTHGSLEWSPGKEVGLWRYDYPSICVDDTPIVYPYIMDNVGEGSQAKHRGNAVIIDHLIPAITNAGLYGELATMHDKLHRYEEEKSVDNTGMMALYRDSMIELYTNLSMENDLGVTPDALRNMTEDDYTNFISVTLHDYLHKLQGTLMPLGIHTFGVAPQDEKLVCMVKSMLRSDFIDHITNLFPYVSGHEDDWEDATEQRACDLLNATILNGTDVSTAQMEVLGLTNDSITADLNLALEYSGHLSQTTREINQTLRALNAEYIEPGPGNDPIRNPDALPTGRNFYGFDQRKFPDEETQAMGAMLADQLVEDYYNNHNDTYPNKVSYVLWAMETLRHHGLMEAQIHSLLGVEPVRDEGRITGFEVISLEDMNHPRIDVLIHSSGLYRDTFPFQLELIDEAVRMVADLNETNVTNYVRWNSLKMEDALLASGYNESTAHYLSRARIFAEAPGNYDNGMETAIAASNTWDNESKLADLFISTSSYIYGQDVWGDGYEDVFTMNLMDIDAAVHSDSTNLFGLLDADGHYGYLGSIGLTIRVLTGETPELYIANQESADNPQMITLKEAFRIELRARNFNPKWITGMMECDYAGARQMMKFAEYLWGWDVVTPDMVTDSDWNTVYDIYIKDKYDLGVDEFLKAENPYQYQAITARMLETIRKDYWDASDEVTQSLVKEYVESVVKDGVTCCHHTCGNPLLDEYIQGIMSVPGVVSEETAAEYNRLMQEATQRETPSDSTQSERYSSGSSTGTAKIIESGNGNQTIESDAGYGTSADPAQEVSMKSTPGNYVEGYEMTRESTPDNAASQPSFSGSDVIGAVLVLLSVGAIFVGFRRRRT